MDSLFFIGILVGLLIAYIFVRLSRPGAKKIADERPEYIDLKKKWYFDDKTKAYITIVAVIFLLLVAAYFYHGDTTSELYNK